MSVIVTDGRDVSELCAIYKANHVHHGEHIAIWWANCDLCEAEDSFMDEHAAVTWGEDHECKQLYLVGDE